jgi:AcrR family transcriptional regulator
MTAPSDRPDTTDPRSAIIDSFLSLLAEKPFERIGLADVANRAGISLADLRASFGSTFDLLAGFTRRTDTLVLKGAGDDMADQPARDRLFDVLMRRLDVLTPHKAALVSLTRSARGNPMLAMGLNKLSVRSQQWMLASAGIDTSGLKGAVRAQGLSLLFLNVLKTFVKDEDPGLARTMSALDRELAKGERALGLMDDLCRLATCGGRRRSSRKAEPAPTPEMKPDLPGDDAALAI